MCEAVDAVEIRLHMKERMRHCVLYLLSASLLVHGTFNEMTEECLVQDVMDEVRLSWFASRIGVDRYKLSKVCYVESHLKIPRGQADVLVLSDEVNSGRAAGICLCLKWSSG